jgi:hypothetical protein
MIATRRWFLSGSHMGPPDHSQTICSGQVSTSRDNIRKKFWSYDFSTLGGERSFAAL